MQNMVELRQVSKSFGSNIALEPLDLEVKEGEFMTFLGPSGCGKTTCLRMISGFENPTAGQVLLEGKDVTHLPPYRRDVNQVFQSYALFPHLSVFENIAFGLRMRKVANGEVKTRVEKAMETVSLQEFGERKTTQLSGGQRQRVALARAIVCEPKVLLLDEPLSALDAKLRHQMRVELKQLQKRLGITFIFVTHDQEEALTMSDRIAVINKGRLEQVGSATEIYHRPATRFVAEFIGDTNIVEAEVLAGGEGGQACRLEGGLVLNVATPKHFQPGSKILVSLRPERVLMHREPRQGANWFPATIENELFRGALDTFTLSVEGGLLLDAVNANESTADDDYQAGEKIFCHLEPDDIHVLSE